MDHDGGRSPATRVIGWPVEPTFASGVLALLAIFFFLAATNTLAGWLYVLCALLLGVLLAGVWLPGQQLGRLTVQRPASCTGEAGRSLLLPLQLHHGGRAALHLCTLADQLPAHLGGLFTHLIDRLDPGSTMDLATPCEGSRRGIYKLDDVRVRTAAPLGLFWRSRRLSAPMTAIVWPRVWPLRRCSLLDRLSAEAEAGRPRRQQDPELTRSVRPYRTGDSRRAIHWRSSARRGVLLSREYEQQAAGAALVLFVDGRSQWQEADFEQALEAAASLFVHWQSLGRPVQLWTGNGGIEDRRQALDHLAGLSPTSADAAPPPASAAVVLRLATGRAPSADLRTCTLLFDSGGGRPEERSIRIDRLRPLDVQLEMLT